MKNDWSGPYSIKIDYSLAPPEFNDVILVLQHSAETGKYGRNDWLKGINFDSDKNYSSIRRHIEDARNGVTKDSDNGLNPWLMVACRALMQYTLDKRKQILNRIDLGDKCENYYHCEECTRYINDEEQKELKNNLDKVELENLKVLDKLSELHEITGQYKMHPQYCFCNQCRSRYTSLNGERY